MGGNAPSRISEDDEGGGITFVKGIRLSDRVITRMKHSSKLNSPHLTPEPPTTPHPAPPVEHLLPFLTPPPPPPHGAPSMEAVSPVKPSIPPPVKFHSFPPAPLESAEPPPPTESVTPPLSTSSPQFEPPAVPESAPPPPDVQLKIPLPPESFVSPHVEAETSTTQQMSEQITEAVVLPPVVETPPSPPCELMTPTSAAEPAQAATSPPPPVEPIIPPIPDDSAPAEAAALSPGLETSLVPPTEFKTARLLEPSAAPHLSLASPSCQCEMLSVVPSDGPVKDPAPAEEEPIMTTCLAPDEEDEAVVTPEPPAAASTVTPQVLEEDLRQKIRAEMQRSLEEEINQNRQNLQQQLEEVRAQAEAEAKAAAQAWVEEQVKKTLEEEKAAHTEKLMESIRKEKMIAMDEKLMIQLYAHQLEEKEKEMKKRDALYKEHVAKLQAKCSEFCEVSAKNFQEGKEEAQKRFAHFNVQPVCRDLQDQILKCYKGNPGKTLTCSRIASAYMQCVDNAKKVQVNT